MNAKETGMRFKKGDKVRVQVPAHEQTVEHGGCSWTETVPTWDEVVTVVRGGKGRATVEGREPTFGSVCRFGVKFASVVAHGGSVEVVE